MEDETSRLVSKVQELGDIELAALLCFIAQEHCIIEADEEELENVEQELGLIASKTFGLSYAVVNCFEGTTVDDFGTGILIEGDNEDIITPAPRLPTFRQAEDSFFSSDAQEWRRSARPPSECLENGQIAEVIIAKNLNLASSQVQIQALELLRGKRIFTRTAVHVAPKRFLFVALLSTSHPKRLVKHLDIDSLILLASKVRLSSDVRSYLHDVVVFTRMHRAVASGVSAMATRHLYALVNALAPLHGIDYVTPSLVALAARKIYSHRLVITTPENERSTQWGSSVEAVAELLDGITVEDIIEDVLETVQVPL
ncbi:hypothetical protein E2P81_ATG05987 [Venturia nashicola]|uniref:magnesium chelatase n=1 Tax=Venturia nashicola TaxID=86259 RepID=A0A4Z1PBQ2_9PEZI|nr:hypothetical protein E6O75_ATG06132 [Venturia nashicola]TLD29693.1 hypothetical protein E2P81_ATG05987 [Venturia nashicola]